MNKLLRNIQQAQEGVMQHKDLVNTTVLREYHSFIQAYGLTERESEQYKSFIIANLDFIMSMNSNIIGLTAIFRQLSRDFLVMGGINETI